MRAFGGRPWSDEGPRRATATKPGALRSAPRGGFGFMRPGLHRRFVPLLIVLTLASSLGVAALAYFGERASAITTAQTHAAQDVRVLRQLLADQGAGVTTNNGQLVVGQDSAQLVLNGNTTVVDRAHDATGAFAAIYQLQGPNLVGVSSNVPTADAHGNPLPGTRLLGDAIGGPAYDALLGTCGAADTPSCHQNYSGVVTLRGVSYVAAYAPLEDDGGSFVGALAVAIPLDSVLAPVTQQAVLLVLVGLLLGMVALVAGYWVFESGARRYFAGLDAQLDAVAAQAGQVSALARIQAARAAQQERTAQQAGEQSRALYALAQAMEQGYTSLREAAGGLWAEMSQPGATPNPARASAQARQAVVVAARVGTGAAQARDLCRHISLLLRQVIAHSHTVTDGGRELDLHATELQGAVLQADATLAERLAQPCERPATSSRRAATGHHTALDPRTVAPQTGTHRTLASRPGQTGAVPRVRPSEGPTRASTGEQPIYRPGISRVTGAFPALPPASPSQWSPQRGPNALSQVPPFAGRSTNPPSRFPNSPSGFYGTPSQFPNTPSQVFGERADALGQLFGQQHSGEWPAPQGSSPSQDGALREQPPRPHEQHHRLGLPDLSTQDHVPDWRDGQPE